MRYAMVKVRWYSKLNLNSFPLNFKVKPSGAMLSNEPTSRYGHTANLYKSSIYVFGGVVNGSVITNELLEYNLKSLR